MYLVEKKSQGGSFYNIKLLSSFPPAISTCWLHKQNLYQSLCELSRSYHQILLTFKR